MSSVESQDSAVPAEIILRWIGFTDDPAVLSDGVGLSLTLPTGRLNASTCINLAAQEITLISGVLYTGRTLCEVVTELPREFDSFELGLAWVSWKLERAGRGHFEPISSFPWLARARESYQILPWLQRQAAYDARPQCRVDREWVRIALRKLALQIALNSDDDPVSFAFDGEVLKVRCGPEVLPMPASGTAWTCAYLLPSAKLRRLPRRLMRNSISFAVWDGAFLIDNYRYDGVAAHHLVTGQGNG